MANSQSIDHWETVIHAEDIWHYFLGNEEPLNNWNTLGFLEDNWLQGSGGIGYGDEDDSTIIPPTLSLYMKRSFVILDTAKIEEIFIHADFDDGLIGYLNGVEILRRNIGEQGVFTPYDEPAFDNHEAQLFQGGLPEPFLYTAQQLQGIWKNGNNVLAFQVHNRKIESSDLSAAFFLSFGMRDSTFSYSAIPEWFAPSFTSSNLPLLFINAYGNGIVDEPKVDAHLGIIYNENGRRNFINEPFNHYNGKIGVEIRGSSSILFLKKNYGFETRLENGENNNVPLLGMPAENDWILHGPFSDKSLMRNVLSYHIGAQTGRYVPRTRWCELFINRQYVGIYVLTERIKQDKNRLDIAKLKPEDISGDELTGGYIFSIDRSDDGEESGWRSEIIPDVFYKYQDPDFEEMMPEQKAYIDQYLDDFEETLDTATLLSTIEQYIDIPSWVDYWLATEIFRHIDAFKLSFYMYKKKDSNGGKLHFGPLWDLNLAYGNFDFGREAGPIGWSYEWAQSMILRPSWVLTLMADSTIQNLAHCRWHELREAGLHTDSLLQFIDKNALLIQEGRIRNFDRWKVLGKYTWPNSFVGTDYESELNFLKNWLIARLEWMDDNMLSEKCFTPFDSIAPKTNPTIITYPNPAGDVVYFRLNDHQYEKGQLQFFNGIGQKISQFEVNQHHDKGYSLRQVDAGFYYYHFIVDEELVEVGKFVKG